MHLTTTTANRKPNHSFLLTAFWSLLALILSTLGAAAATFTVSNTNASGTGSLRQAVISANTTAGADTIVFDSLFSTAQTITLSASLQIDSADNSSLTITGPGANLLTVSGGNAVRIFEILDSETANISGMTITQGNSLGGTSPGQGGAIYINQATVTLNNLIITGNSAITGSSVPAGGGIFSFETILTITNSTITNNSTSYGGGIESTGSQGTTRASLTLTNTTVSNNTVGLDPQSNAGSGGGFRVVGNSVSTSINNSTITGNSSIGPGAGFITYTNGPVNITDSVISNNTSSLERGGGIYRQFGDILTIRNTSITGNSAGGDGGGIYDLFCAGLNVIGSTISNNSSGNNNGGGISVLGGAATVTTSTISGNNAANGGGIHAISNFGFDGFTNIPLIVTNSTVSGNTATTGGGILATSRLSLINSTVSGNAANQNGGGVLIARAGDFETVHNIINSTIVNNSTDVLGGGLSRSDSTVDVIVNLSNAIIANNTAASSAPDISGVYNSQGYNLIKDTSGATLDGTTTGNITGVDPQLGPLQDNGGMSFTHALLADSPAIDKGKSADVMTDQRALPRPHDYPSIPNAAGGDGSDIGAFEDQPPNTVPGNDVTVEAPAGDASVTFKSITQAGFTTFAEIVPPSSAGSPPAGYIILEDAPAYDINTTAIYTAPITVCFTVDSITDEAEFARVRILHGEDGVLVDRTDLSSLAFGSRTVCAQVDSLSPFVIALAPAPAPGLLNISTRLQVLTGDQVLIGGFIVTGTDPKMVILRAIGPSLGAFGISGPLADPVLELRAGDGSLIMTNDNWQTDQLDAITATGLAPTDDLESAIIATLNPGNYTAIVSGSNGGTGVGLVEAYDLDQTAASELANISTRGFVDTGNNVMIGGFILGSDTNVLVRAIGPTLSDFGVTGALEDPNLELRDGQGTLVSSNDNWMDSAQKTEIEGTGLAPQKDPESAVLEMLPTGAYTAIVSGQGGTAGVGLVEVYRLP